MPDEPDQPGRGRRAVTRTGWVLVVAAALALAATLTPLLAWSQAGDEPSLWARSLPAAIAVLVLGPAASLVVAVAWVRAPAGRGGAVLLAVAAVVAGWVAWVQLSGVADRQLGPGGPVAVLAAAALIVGWVLVGTGWPAAAVTGGGVVPWLVAVCVLGLLVAAAVPAVGWYRTGRLVDHTTASPLPETPAADPADLARERWRVPAPGGQLVGTTGRYVVVRSATAGSEPVGTGVRVVDGETGDEHWRYRRTDLAAEVATLSGDGAVVVVLFTAYDQRRLLALETATGQLRWQRDLPADVLGADSFGIDALVAGGVVALTTQCGISARHQIRGELLDYQCQEEHGEVWAVDAQTGETRWQWAPEPIPRDGEADGPAEAPCWGVAAAPAGDTLVVQVECPTEYFDGGFDPWFGPALQQFVGLAADDGTERWRREPPELADHRLGPRGYPPEEEEPVLRPLGDAVLAPLGGGYQAPDGSIIELPPRWVALAGADGAELSTMEVDELLAATDELAIYVEGQAPVEAVAVDPTTGEPRWRSRLPSNGSSHEQRLAATSSQTGYLLWFRGERVGDQLRPSGEVAMVTVDLAGGAVTEAGSHELANLVCPRDPCVGLAGGGLVLVTVPPEAPDQAALISLG
ncbi:MAG: PQQ-binding-like beta-propeller repeat protein [Micromonosporaceae bacterium]|nr:PQQ-binding-like beta-propeller repeat protein [Micromonosporaceae bacterium]